MSDEVAGAPAGQEDADRSPSGATGPAPAGSWASPGGPPEKPVPSGDPKFVPAGSPRPPRLLAPPGTAPIPLRPPPLRPVPLRPPPGLPPPGRAILTGPREAGRAPAWDPRGQAPEWLSRTDAGLRRMPDRPVYREPLPVRPERVGLGALAGVGWMALFGAQAGTAREYAWLTILAGLLAWAAAVVLGRYGDRGAAVGVALASAVGVAVMALVVVVRWVGGDWLLW